MFSAMVPLTRAVETCSICALLEVKAAFVCADNNKRATSALLGILWIRPSILMAGNSVDLYESCW